MNAFRPPHIAQTHDDPPRLLRFFRDGQTSCLVYVFLCLLQAMERKGGA